MDELNYNRSYKHGSINTSVIQVRKHCTLTNVSVITDFWFVLRIEKKIRFELDGGKGYGVCKFSKRLVLNEK